LDSQRCQQYYRPALQLAEQSLGGLLGAARGSMMGNHRYVLHPVDSYDIDRMTARMIFIGILQDCV
jgi:hypothetical protein